ncbi:MAG TPA: hypothetical protein VMS86_09295 [Thermoanaerobaculia bacterium]|nr:hypothetical protein [Thermoanaerobaculia bacterium]
MSTDLDWSRLEGSVARTAARLQSLARENQSLRAEVARLEAELESVRVAGSSPEGARTAEVRRRLERLEGELQALLG